MSNDLFFINIVFFRAVSLLLAFHISVNCSDRETGNLLVIQLSNHSSLAVLVQDPLVRRREEAVGRAGTQLLQDQPYRR